MQKIHSTIIVLLVGVFSAYSQPTLTEVETRSFPTTKDLKIDGDIGYMVVPESRLNPSERKTKVKYVHLRSIAENPGTPVVFLEGGNGVSTWQAESPEDLDDWLPILEVSDLIFVDRRGTDDEALTYIWLEEYPKYFLVSEDSANLHYQRMAKAALATYEEKNIDVTGYDIVDHAQDVQDLMTSLNIDQYNLLGFSFGTHIGMTVMELYPENIERAILVGSDAPNQSFNFPSYLDAHIEKIADLVRQDAELSRTIPDFRSLVEKVMRKLNDDPATVTVKNPLTGEDMDLQIGAFGLALILRLDIDDASDIPAIPRLLYTIDQGDYAMLTWFAQKRMVFGLAVPGGDINQQLASGASPSRWQRIEQEANESIFGNAVNFPFSAVKDRWIPNELTWDTTIPMQSDIPTLFITGTLDCRTPVEQVNRTMAGFSNGVHVEVVNAGHDQSLWNRETFDETIPQFLKGEAIKLRDSYYGDIEFLPLIGPTTAHPSTR